MGDMVNLTIGVKQSHIYHRDESKSNIKQSYP